MVLLAFRVIHFFFREICARGRAAGQSPARGLERTQVLLKFGAGSVIYCERSERNEYGSYFYKSFPGHFFFFEYYIFDQKTACHSIHTLSRRLFLFCRPLLIDCSRAPHRHRSVTNTHAVHRKTRQSDEHRSALFQMRHLSGCFSLSFLVHGILRLYAVFFVAFRRSISRDDQIMMAMEKL